MRIRREHDSCRVCSKLATAGGVGPVYRAQLAPEHVSVLLEERLGPEPPQGLIFEAPGPHLDAPRGPLGTLVAPQCALLGARASPK